MVTNHLLVFAVLIVFYPYSKFLGFEKVVIGIIYFYIAVYGLSILENFRALGVPFPKWLEESLLKINIFKQM